MKKYLRLFLRKNNELVEPPIFVFFCLILPGWIVLGLFWEFSVWSFFATVAMVFVCFFCGLTEYATGFFDFNRSINFYNFWWRLFSLYVNTNHYKQFDTQLAEEWCAENCCGPFHRDLNGNWYFLLNKDLLAFRLRYE